MRLRLAQLMYQDTNFLILDEPTNHLDVESREVLEEALEDYNGTILAVSHDRYFLNKLFNKIYWIDSKKIHCFEGNYNYAKEKMAERMIHQKDHRLNKSDHRSVKSKETGPEREKKVENKGKADNLEKELAVLEQKIYTIFYRLKQKNIKN